MTHELNLSYEVTPEDVHSAIEILENAMTPFNEEAEELANIVLSKLDTQKIADESLSGNDIDEQNDYAIAEIMIQIKTKQLIDLINY